jgi:hypothetical protein
MDREAVQVALGVLTLRFHGHGECRRSWRTLAG